MSFFSSIGKILGVAAAPFTGGASLLPSLISGGASIVGGVLQNNSAKSLAQSSNAQAIELANTAHQREVLDLQKAGLNPILSAGGNGASTPTIQTAPVGNVLGSAASSALNASLVKAQIENAQKSNENIDADTELKRSQTQESIARYYSIDQARELSKAQTAQTAANARSAAIQAQSDEDMGAFTRNLEKGGAAAQSIARVVQIMRQMGVGR